MCGMLQQGQKWNIRSQQLITRLVNLGSHAFKKAGHGQTYEDVRSFQMGFTQQILLMDIKKYFLFKLT